MLREREQVHQGVSRVHRRIGVCLEQAFLVLDAVNVFLLCDL